MGCSLCFLKNSFDNLAPERVLIINPDITKEVRRCHSQSQRFYNPREAVVKEQKTKPTHALQNKKQKLKTQKTNCELRESHVKGRQVHGDKRVPPEAGWGRGKLATSGPTPLHPGCCPAETPPKASRRALNTLVGNTAQTKQPRERWPDSQKSPGRPP